MQHILIIFFSLSFSFNAFAQNTMTSKDILTCGDNHTPERYHSLHALIENSQDNINVHLVYNLAKVSLCLNNDQEGLEYLHQASDAGHILATLLLGIYYRYNQTFSSTEKTTDLTKLDKAIQYFTKGMQLITSLPGYPKGSTIDMEYIESVSYTSYHLFAQLPFLHFKKFAITMDDIFNNKETKYSGTLLDTLDKTIETSSICVERPALDVWSKTKDTIYIAQQLRCKAMLHFAKAAYPLEQQRIKIAADCTTSLNICSEHQEIVTKIYQLAKEMHHQIQFAPFIPWSNPEYQQVKPSHFL